MSFYFDKQIAINAVLVDICRINLGLIAISIDHENARASCTTIVNPKDTVVAVADVRALTFVEGELHRHVVRTIDAYTCDWLRNLEEVTALGAL